MQQDPAEYRKELIKQGHTGFMLNAMCTIYQSQRYRNMNQNHDDKRTESYFTSIDRFSGVIIKPFTLQEEELKSH